MDWNQLGTAIAGLAVGAGSVLIPWLRARRRRLQTEEPWDGMTERRRHRERLSGTRVLAILEDDEPRMPRHWMAFIDDRIVHKIDNAVNPILAKIDNIERDVADMKPSVEKTETQVNRLIGRLLPNEPIG